jgi:hypothetical protein
VRSSWLDKNELTGTIGSWIGGMAKLAFLCGPRRRGCVVTVRCCVLAHSMAGRRGRHQSRGLSAYDDGRVWQPYVRRCSAIGGGTAGVVLRENYRMRGDMGGNACGLSVYECVGCHARFTGHHHVTHALRGAVAGLLTTMG